MSRQVALLERTDNPLQFAQQVGQVFARSHMFGCRDEHQGQVMALACLIENISPIELMRKYHIIDGRLEMRADAMLAEFQRIGGSCAWKATGDDGEKAVAQFVYKGNDITLGYSIEDAKRAGLVQKKGDVWKKHTGAMLRARLISKAIRMLAPQVNAGAYAAEELTDDPEAIQVQSEVAAPSTSTPAAEEPETVTDETATETQPDQYVESTNGLATATQISRFKTLFTELRSAGVEKQEVIDAMQKNCEQTQFRFLTHGDADKFLAWMEGEKSKREAMF